MLKTDINRKKWRRIHRVSGRAYLMSTYLIVVTAIWIKPSDVDWDIISFFIFSMYIALVVGFFCIKMREVRSKKKLVFDSY